MNKLTLSVLLVLALILVGGGTLFWQKYQPDRNQTDDLLPDFTFETLEGEQWKSSDWHDKILIINFWATWCPPCRAEMPLFVDLQEEFQDQDVQFVGIAIDNKDHVQDFVDTYGIEFPILLGDRQGSELGRQLGNRMGGLPYTVIVAKGGKIHKKHIGGLKEAQLRPILELLTKS